jgi:glutamyl-tRNA synthetase
MNLEETVFKYALINAYQHNGKANPKAVIGKVLGENPELRPKAREIIPLVNEVVEKVNSLSTEEQESKLREIYPEFFEEKAEKKEEKKGLPPLPKAEKGKVVTRFAPNPDGVFHLGNARAAILSHEYARLYGGKFILRLNDTDPKVKRPEPIFYEWILEDLEWLGMKPDEVHTASDRLELYYSYAE